MDELAEPFRLKTEIEGRLYELVCLQESPLPHVHAALQQMIRWCEEQAGIAEEKNKECIEVQPVQE